MSWPPVAQGLLLALPPAPFFLPLLPPLLPGSRGPPEGVLGPAAAAAAATAGPALVVVPAPPLSLLLPSSSSDQLSSQYSPLRRNMDGISKQHVVCVHVGMGALPGPAVVCMAHACICMHARWACSRLLLRLLWEWDSDDEHGPHTQ